MEPSTWQELTALVNDLWARLHAVHARDTSLYALAVVALVFVEALALGAILDLLLPKGHPARRPAAKRRRRK